MFKPITLLNKHSFFCTLMYSSSCLLLFAILEPSLKETANTDECVQCVPRKMQELCTSYVKTQNPNRCLTIQERTWREMQKLALPLWIYCIIGLNSCLTCFSKALPSQTHNLSFVGQLPSSFHFIIEKSFFLIFCLFCDKFARPLYQSFLSFRVAIFII